VGCTDADPFEATVAIGQDWVFIDTMGSVRVAHGLLQLRTSDGAVIVEAPTNEVYAKQWVGATKVWVGGSCYSIERPKATPWTVKAGVRRTRKITRAFLEALEEHGGHIGKPHDAAHWERPRGLFLFAGLSIFGLLLFLFGHATAIRLGGFLVFTCAGFGQVAVLQARRRSRPR